MMYFWLGIIIVLGFLEIITINLVSIWFIISGIVALVLSFFVDSFVIQFGVFVVLGIILMITTRDVLTRKLVHNEKTNLDRVIGKMGVVTEEIKKHEVGEVKVLGKRWSAVSNKSFMKGDKVKVLKINGVKLEVDSWED